MGVGTAAGAQLLLPAAAEGSMLFKDLDSEFAASVCCCCCWGLLDVTEGRSVLGCGIGLFFSVDGGLLAEVRGADGGGGVSGGSCCSCCSSEEEQLEEEESEAGDGGCDSWEAEAVAPEAAGDAAAEGGGETGGRWLLPQPPA